MLYFTMNDGTVNGDVLGVTTESGGDGVSRRQFETFAIAERIAASANELNDGETYVATDSGPFVSPRYDVIRAPKVGAEVSYTFNGDYYPCGKIVSVGDGSKMIVKTDTGEVFYRRLLTGNWLKKGGTWSLVGGHSNEKNPCF